MEDKNIYSNRRRNRHNSSQIQNEKKNLLVESNDSEEVKNILAFNEQIKENIPDYDELEVVPKSTSKKRYFSFNKGMLKYGLSLSIFLIAIFGVSYSFFNYRKEDSRQADISAGEVYVRLVENATSITLPKMYPRTDEEARARDDNYFDFTIKGKNTSYTKSILYTINVTDGESVSGKTRINRDYIKVDLQQKVGQTYEYISEGVKLSDFNFTGAVLTSTTNEITREYRLRFWISDDVTISDTDQNAIYTTIQFNNIYATYNVSVSSEDKAIAYDLIAKNADTTTLIDFANISSPTNGQGLYRLTGTGNDNYPIYYYRGAVDNNNVVFGGFCWQIVRTTDTGGIKMIYNGEPNIVNNGNNISYDCGSARPSEYIGEIAFRSTRINSTPGYYYADDYEIVSESESSVTYRLKSLTNPITQVLVTDSNAEASIATIASNYPYTCMLTSSDGTCTTLYKIVGWNHDTYAFVYRSTKIWSIGNDSFYHYNIDPSLHELSKIGFMYNRDYYFFTDQTLPSGIYYGGSIEYGDFDSDGTSEYRLVSGTTSTSLNSTHHYTCASTSSTATCPNIRYYYYAKNQRYAYITLSDGETVEDALYKMTGNGSDEVKQRAINKDYVINMNDSNAKWALEHWFELKLTNLVNTNNMDYQSYIEDTIYCNNRSYKTIEGNLYYPTYQNSGWNPNGGDLTKQLTFEVYNRHWNNWYSTSNVPSFACANLTDQFKVSNAFAKLKYPVGLITHDEAVLVGLGGNSSETNTTYYLYKNKNTMTMTPGNIDSVDAVNAYTSLADSDEIRPVISLKLGIEFETGGDGTPTNPYIVKYN